MVRVFHPHPHHALRAEVLRSATRWYTPGSGSIRLDGVGSALVNARQIGQNAADFFDEGIPQQMDVHDETMLIILIMQIKP